MINHRLFSIPASFTLLCLMWVNSQATPILTGAAQFSTDSLGNLSGGQGWNTFGGDAASNLYITSPNSGINGSFINSGNSNPSTRINTALGVGSHTFFIFGDQGVDIGTFGLNLFFNSDDSSARLSVFSPTSSTSPPPFPSFLSNSSANTPDLTFSATIPGSGALSFSDGSFNIGISDYLFMAPSVNNLDRVQHLNNAPNNVTDFVGQFTLTVTPTTSIPEPSILALFLLAFGGLLYKKRRSVSTQLSP